MKKIILFGNSGISKMVAELIHSDTEDRVVAFTVDEAYLTEKTSYEGIPVIAFHKIKDLFPPGEYSFLCTLTSAVKKKHYNSTVIKNAKALGYSLYTFIHSKAFVAPSVRIGENVIMFPFSAAETNTKVGDGVIMRSGSQLSHDSEIGAYSYMAPHSVISGLVKTGIHCFFGTNSTVRDQINIGKDVVIGAGAVVSRDLADEKILRAARSEILDKDRFKLKI